MSRLTKVVVAAAGVVVAAGITVLERTPRGRRLSRRMAHQVARLARYESGRLEGLRYHLAGRSPDPTVTDALLADRVRSSLGPLEHRLEIPRVHVTACGHDVMLHGEVDSPWHADEVGEAVSKMPGVARVESRLRVGPLRAENRPAHAHRRAG
jgi:osmotically-inducible protein OsmY